MSNMSDQIDNEYLSSLHNSRGINLAKRGWLDEAINEFEVAIKKSPKSVESYDNLGNAYVDKGELLRALQSYVKALSIDPNNAIVMHNLGCFLSNYSDSLANKCFKNALVIEPDFAEAQFNLGLCHMAEEEYPEAINRFEEALLIEEDHDTRLHLAMAFMGLEKYPRAIKELIRITKYDSSNEQAWYNLGLSYNKQGFLEESLAAFSESIKLDPNNLDSILSLASLLVRLRRDKEAKAFINQAVRLDRNKAKDFIYEDEYLSEYKPALSKFK